MPNIDGFRTVYSNRESLKSSLHVSIPSLVSMLTKLQAPDLIQSFTCAYEGSTFTIDIVPTSIDRSTLKKYTRVKLDLRNFKTLHIVIKNGTFVSILDYEDFSKNYSYDMLPVSDFEL